MLTAPKIADFPIFERKKWEFEELVPKFLDLIFETINMPDVSFIKWTWHDEISREIDVDVCKIIHLHLKIFEEEKIFKLRLPWLMNDNTFYLSGNRYHPLFQIIDRPIVTTKKHIRMMSNTNLTLVNKSGKVVIFKKKLTLQTFLLSKFSLIETLDYMEVKYKTVPINTITEEGLAILPISADDAIVINHSVYEETSPFLWKYIDNLHKDAKRNKKLYFNDKSDKDFYTSLFRKEFRKNNIEYEKFQFDNFFDPIIKKYHGYNKDIQYYIMDAMREHAKYDSDLITSKRVRFSEWLLVPLMIQVRSLILKVLSNNDQSSWKRLNIDKDIIVNDMYRSGLAQTAVDANLLQDLSYYTRCSLSGVHGISPESATINNRVIKEDQKSNICPIDTSDGKNVGIIRNLSISVDLDKNGYFVGGKW